MHILLLNEYFPPDTSATAKMAATTVEALAARHRVTVVCGRPSYDPTEHFPWRLLRRESRGNVLVERMGSTAFPRFQMKRRVANYLSFSFLGVVRALLIRSDVILAMTDPPFCGILGAFVSMLTGRPLIYNIRDMYPDMALGGDIVKPGLLARIWEQLHCWALRRARKVIVLGEDMRDRIVAKGVDRSRIAVVRDGARIPDHLPAADNAVAREIRGDAHFVAIHAGNLGFYGAWDTLLAAARTLGGTGSRIIFVGDGAEKQRLVAASAALDSVRFLPFRPASDIPYVLSAGDAHIVTIKRGLEGVIVPSKLYPILAAAKPVIAVADQRTDVARIVAEAGCGVVVDPDDPQALACAIRDLAANPARVAEMGRRAHTIAPKYDTVQELYHFVTVVEEAIEHA